jgi:hypothetical protein
MTLRMSRCLLWMHLVQLRRAKLFPDPAEHGIEDASLRHRPTVLTPRIHHGMPESHDMSAPRISIAQDTRGRDDKHFRGTSFTLFPVSFAIDRCLFTRKLFSSQVVPKRSYTSVIR